MTSPSGAARPGARTVEVHVARGRVDRIWVPIVVLHLFIVAITVAVLVFAATHGSGMVVAPFLLVVAIELFQVWTICTVWLGLRRTEVPIELRTDGVVLRTARGAVSAPWAAIATIGVERHLLGRRIRFRLVPASDPRHSSIRSEVTGRMARIVERDGLVYATRVLDVEPERLAALVTQQSGRVVTLP